MIQIQTATQLQAKSLFVPEIHQLLSDFTSM